MNYVPIPKSSSALCQELGFRLGGSFCWDSSRCVSEAGPPAPLRVSVWSLPSQALGAHACRGLLGEGVEQMPVWLRTATSRWGPGACGGEERKTWASVVTAVLLASLCPPHMTVALAGAPCVCECGRGG